MSDDKEAKEYRWKNISTMPSVFVFQTSKGNELLDAPKEINYVYGQYIVPSLRSIYYPYFIQGYRMDIRNNSSQVACYLDIQTARTAYRETRYSASNYAGWEVLGTSTHTFPSNVRNISFRLIAGNDFGQSLTGISAICLDLTINGTYFKRITGNRVIGDFGWGDAQKFWRVYELEETVDISTSNLNTSGSNTLTLQYGAIQNGSYRKNLNQSANFGGMLDYIFYEFDPDIYYTDARELPELNYEIDLIYFHPTSIY